MTSRRVLAAVVAVGAALALLSGCGQSDTEKALAKYDPSEVQMLRDQGKQGGIAVDDELLLSTLQSRDDCRTIRAALQDLTAGKKSGSAVDKFSALPAANRDRGQGYMADSFQTMVDKALLGDPSQAKLYHEQNCTDVK